MSISVLHPSRNRPEKAFQTAKKWFNRSGLNSIEYILSLDTDDERLAEYPNQMLTQTGNHKGFVIKNPNRSAVDAINNAAKIATGDILIVVSDDTDCPENWGQLIEMETVGKKDFVLRFEDGIQPWLITMPVIDRAYYNRFGYIYYPEFRHMFCDTTFSHIAYGLNKVIRSHHLFQHLHYSVRGLGIKPDEINHRADRTTTEGRNLYLALFQRGFDIPGFDVWNFDDNDHLKWLAAHGFKPRNTRHGR